MLSLEPMRIGYVLKKYPRYSETFIVNEILAHESSGLEIEIFSLRSPDGGHFQDSIAKVRAFTNYLPYEGLKACDFWAVVQNASEVLPDILNALKEARGEDARNVYQALLIALEVRRKGIHHLHAHFGTVATTVARLAARFGGVSYTFTAHAKDIFHESVNKSDMKRKISDAKMVVTISDSNYDYLCKTYCLDKTQVKRIYNGLDVRKFQYSSPLKRPSRIISVSRLVEKKGLVDLVEACSVLASRNLEFICEIIGTGPLELDLRSQIDRLGLGETVKLVGPRPQDEIIEHIQSAAVFAAPCVIGSDGNRDGLPTVLLEAMALGTPCVSTDVNGIPEVLHHETTGLMVQQHDPISLANAIERLFTDPALRVNLAKNARYLFETKFDIYRNATELRSVFRRAVGIEVKTAQEVLT
ncbi:MAG: glycosyltransferase family 4 protein [Candidatus Bathyarchaeia archaeon]